MGLAAHGTAKPQLAHEALHRATSDHDALAVQLTPELASAVDAEVRGVNATDVSLQLGVAELAAQGGLDLTS
jgi:hypothetical protein